MLHFTGCPPVVSRGESRRHISSGVTMCLSRAGGSFNLLGAARESAARRVGSRPYRGGAQLLPPGRRYGHGGDVRRIYEPLTAGRSRVCAFPALRQIQAPAVVFNMRQTS